LFEIFQGGELNFENNGIFSTQRFDDSEEKQEEILKEQQERLHFEEQQELARQRPCYFLFGCFSSPSSSFAIITWLARFISNQTAFAPLFGILTVVVLAFSMRVGTSCRQKALRLDVLLVEFCA